MTWTAFAILAMFVMYWAMVGMFAPSPSGMIMVVIMVLLMVAMITIAESWL